MAAEATRGKEAALEIFFARLERHGPLEPACRDAIRRSATPPRTLRKGEEFGAPDRPVDALAVLCHGLVLNSRHLPDGRQQHLALQIAGEMLDLEGYFLGRTNVSLAALTPCVIVHLPRSALDTVLAEHPSLLKALSREMAANVRLAQEWMLNMGRRSAKERLAHLLCEVCIRFSGSAMPSGSDVILPFTQAELADLLGLSVVHINRTLQEMRRNKLVSLSQGRLTLLDPQRVREVAGFDPGYLH